MAFQILPVKEEDLDLLQITDMETDLRIRILPSIGALLHEFSIPYENRRIQVINGYKNENDLKANLSLSYKSAKLSPFTCRISGGKYTFEGRTFEFRNKFNDGSAIHGILFDKTFLVKEQTVSENEASISMEFVYQQEDPAYPFNYIINIKYTLKTGGRLLLETTVTNISSGRIPIADGWHPYFNLDGRVNEWLLSFRSGKNLVFNEKLIPVGHLIDSYQFYKPKIIGDECFDHCFLLEPVSDLDTVILENPVNGLRLTINPDLHYPYLQIYTPPDRKSIAIENLSGAPDCFNNGLGLIILEPGASQSFSVVYQVDFN